MRCSDEHCDKMSPENAPLLISHGPGALCQETWRTAFQLFLKLPGDINYMHPFRNLEVFRVPPKGPPFTSARGRCRALIARPGQAPERRSTNPCPCQAQTRQGGYLPCSSSSPSCSAKCSTLSGYSEMSVKWMKKRKVKEGNYYSN